MIHFVVYDKKIFWNLDQSDWHIINCGGHAMAEFRIGTKTTSLVKDQLFNISAKFGWNLFSGFREEYENVKS